MREISPLKLIIIGFALLLLGFLATFAMVIQLVEPGFALSFLAYASSFVGLMLGLVGVARYSGKGRR